MTIWGLLWLGVVQGAEVRGIVVGPNGEVVDGATVVAYDYRLMFVSDVTDDQGQFSVNHPSAKAVRLHIIPTPESGLSEELGMGEWTVCAARPYSDGAEITWSLRAAASVTGRLLKPDGTVAADASITAIPVLPYDLPFPGTRTDSMGFFDLDGLHPGVGGVRLQFDSDEAPRQYRGGVYAESEGEIVPIADAERLDIGDEVLLAGVTVAGQVSGPDGPIDAAEVRAYSPGQVRSTTSTEGRYRIDGLPPGEALAWASAPGLATTYYPDSDRPDQRVFLQENDTYEAMDLSLPAEGRIRGVLAVDEDFDGGTVLVYNDARTVGFGGEIDEKGMFDVGGLHTGAYTIELYTASAGFVDDWVRDETGMIRTVLVESGAVTDVSVAVPKGASLGLRAVDRYTGEPIPGVSVQASDQSTGRQRAVAMDGDGAATMPGFRPGQWSLRASYTPFCYGDPNWVATYYDDARSEGDQVLVSLAAGEHLQWTARLAPDNDYDEMDDVWEAEMGLDPNRGDGFEDPDGDGLSNLEEYRAGSDPLVGPLADGCGCRSNTSDAAYFVIPYLFFSRRRKCILG